MWNGGSPLVLQGIVASYCGGVWAGGIPSCSQWKHGTLFYWTKHEMNPQTSWESQAAFSINSGAVFSAVGVWCHEPPTKVIEFILGSQHQLWCQGSLVGNDDPFILPHILFLLLNWIAIWIVLKRACLTWMMVIFFLTLMPFVPLVMKADTDTACCRCWCDSCRCNLSHSVHSKQSCLASISFVLYPNLQVFSLNGRSQGGVRDILNQSALRSLWAFLCLWY